MDWIFSHQYITMTTQHGGHIVTNSHGQTDMGSTWISHCVTEAVYNINLEWKFSIRDMAHIGFATFCIPPACENRDMAQFQSHTSLGQIKGFIFDNISICKKQLSAFCEKVLFILLFSTSCKCYNHPWHIYFPKIKHDTQPKTQI